MSKPPRRVGYVVKTYPRYSETFIVNEILAHEAAGQEVEIFSLRPPSDTHFQNVIALVRAPVTYIGSDLRRASELWEVVRSACQSLPGGWDALQEARYEDARDLAQAIDLALEVRRRGIDHLHAHFATVPATVARLAARFAGIPYTFTAHAKDIFHQGVDPEALRRNLREAAATVTVSDYNVEYLRSEHGDAAARVCRVYNGLDLQRFGYSEPRGSSRRIVAVGRLVEKKGFSQLIAACAILRDRGKAFDCSIVGSGPLEETLRSQIARLGLTGRVVLLGPRPQAEVIELIREAAAFVAPCIDASDGDRDGLPTVLLEAMALGTPCLSTDVTGIPEILRDGETGLLVPQRAPERLAGAIDSLLERPSMGVRLSQNARQLIEAEFDIHRNARRIREIFAGSSRRSEAEAA